MLPEVGTFVPPSDGAACMGGDPQVYTHPGTAHGALVFNVGRLPFWEQPFSSCSTNSPPRRFRKAHMFRKHWGESHGGVKVSRERQGGGEHGRMKTRANVKRSELEPPCWQHLVLGTVSGHDSLLSLGHVKLRWRCRLP